VFDLMIHDIDLVLGLVKSPVRSVSALGMPVFGPNEDVAQARIEFQDGTVADLSASRASYQPSRKLRVWSGDGFVSVDFATRQATVLRPSESLASGEPDWRWKLLERVIARVRVLLDPEVLAQLEAASGKDDLAREFRIGEAQILVGKRIPLRRIAGEFLHPQGNDLHPCRAIRRDDVREIGRTGEIRVHTAKLHAIQSQLNNLPGQHGNVFATAEAITLHRQIEEG